MGQTGATRKRSSYSSDQAAEDFDTLSDALLRNEETLTAAANRTLRRYDRVLPIRGTVLDRRARVARIVLRKGDDWANIREAAELWRSFGG